MEQEDAFHSNRIDVPLLGESEQSNDTTMLCENIVCEIMVADRD